MAYRNVNIVRVVIILYPWLGHIALHFYHRPSADQPANCWSSATLAFRHLTCQMQASLPWVQVTAHFGRVASATANGCSSQFPPFSIASLELGATGGDVSFICKEILGIASNAVAAHMVGILDR